MSTAPDSATPMSATTYSRLPEQDLEVVASDGLKRKHLNKDCPHLVPLNYKVIVCDEDEPPKRSWLYRFFFGKGDPVKKRKRTFWSIFGCGLLVAVSLFLIMRRATFSLDFTSRNSITNH